MNKSSRRHTNNDFSRSTNLVLADVLMSGMLGIIFLGISVQYDKGLMIYLPPYSIEMEDTIKISSSSILHVDIDSSSQLRLNNTPFLFSEAEREIYNFTLEKLWNDSKSYIWIRVDRSSKYKYYIRLRDIIKRVEKALLNDVSVRYYGEPYSNALSSLWRERIHSSVAFCIIEEDKLEEPYFELRAFANCN